MLFIKVKLFQKFENLFDCSITIILKSSLWTMGLGNKKAASTETAFLKNNFRWKGCLPQIYCTTSLTTSVQPRVTALRKYRPFA